MPWRTIEGETLAPATMPQLEVLLRGVFDKRRFLDLIRHFIVFDDDARRDWSLGGQQAITITGANRSLIFDRVLLWLKAARSSNQRPTFEPAVSSRLTAPMPSSAQSSSARNHKSTGKPPSPFKKKSNIACTSIICAQAGADRISTGDSDGALALLPAKAQPEPADCGARCECCSRTALYQDRWLPKKTPVSRVILAP